MAQARFRDRSTRAIPRTTGPVGPVLAGAEEPPELSGAQKESGLAQPLEPSEPAVAFDEKEQAAEPQAPPALELKQNCCGLERAQSG